VAGELGPAVHRHLAVLGVQADDDVAGESNAGVMEETGVFHRRRTDNDVADAPVQVTFDGVQVPNAAPQLYGDVIPHSLDDGLDGRFVLGFTGKGTVQVHQMEAAGALFQPVGGHGARVFGKNRGLVHHPLFQTDALAIFQVNRGNDQHGKFSCRKRRRKTGAIRVANVGNSSAGPSRPGHSFPGETGPQRYYLGPPHR